MAKKYEKMLTTGALAKMLQGDTPVNPVLQLLSIKCVPGSSSNPESVDRFRLSVTDGIGSHSYVMLATTLNHVVTNEVIDKHCIFRVDKYVPSKVNRDGPNDRNVIIFFNLTVLAKGTEVGEQVVLKPEASSAVKENVNTNGSGSNNNSGSNNKYRPHDGTAVSFNQVGEGFHDLVSHLTMPIESLSPYQNKWVIKARVTAKSVVRTWNNAKGEGKLFSFDVCDETSEIRITGFRDMVDKWYDTIEVDKVYFITKCQIKPANKQYSKLKNDYEMTMNSDTVLELCTEEVDSIPKLHYDFIPIAEIGEKQSEAIIDVLGVCKEATDAVKLTAKTTGRELTKREVTLVDRSNASITLTLWGEEAANFHNLNNPVILLKNVMVKEYGGGKTLSPISSTIIKINPDMPESHQIHAWYEDHGNGGQFNTLSSRNAAGGGLSTDWMTFHDVKERQLGNGDKADYFQTVAMVHAIKQANMLYKACPNQDCNKKVVDNNDGTYRCEKCNIDGPGFKNRLLTNVLIGDWTSNRWVTLFADIAEQVLGKNGDEIAKLLECEKTETEAYFNERQFRPMCYKLRTKVENYGDVPRQKTTAVALADVPYKEYNAMMLENIRRHTGIGKAPKTE